MNQQKIPANSANSGAAGTIYLVAAPIGNFADITVRALETLRAADYIACEDTRVTGMLLKHYAIVKPLLQYHDYNEERAANKIIELAKQGSVIAMVSDAGTPGISDPGYRLVQAAIAEQIAIQALPGPSALLPALTLSGLPVHSFTFRGFAPNKSSARRRFLSVDAQSPYTLIYYESPYRLAAFLEDAADLFGDRPAAVAHELTKTFESIHRGTLRELTAYFQTHPPRGEYVVVIAGAE